MPLPHQDTPVLHTAATTHACVCVMCVKRLGEEKSFLSRSVAPKTDLLSALQINTSNSQPSAGSGGEVTDITEMAVPVMRNLQCDASELDSGTWLRCQLLSRFDRWNALFEGTQSQNEKDVLGTTMKLRTWGKTK